MKKLTVGLIVVAVCLAAAPAPKHGIVKIDGNNIELGAAVRIVRPLVDVQITGIRKGTVLEDESECLIITGTVCSHLESKWYRYTIGFDLYGVYPDCVPHPAHNTHLNAATVSIARIPLHKPVPFVVAIPKGYMAQGKDSNVHYVTHIEFVKLPELLEK